jgi:hypothetical protein
VYTEAELKGRVQRRVFPLPDPEREPAAAHRAGWRDSDKNHERERTKGHT